MVRLAISPSQGLADDFAIVEDARMPVVTHGVATGHRDDLGLGQLTRNHAAQDSHFVVFIAVHAC